MGYCMNQREASFKMKKENFEPCLKALKKLATQASKKGSGGSGGMGKWTSSFAWVTTEVFANAKTVKEALEEWRWDVEEDKNGNIDGILFSGDKSGDDTKLFEAIAPYVESGSYIEMSGEDGAIWRWKFDAGKCTEDSVTLDWDNCSEIVANLLKEKKILPTLIGIHPSLDKKIGEILKEK